MKSKILIKNILLLFAFTLIFCISSVDALSCEETSYGCIEKETCINIPQIANATTYCNITKLYYPNKSISFKNFGMTKDGISYNFTYCNTSVLGQYIVEGECDGEVWTNDFKVTPTGYEASTSQGFISFFSILLMVFLSMVCLILAWAFKHPFVKVFFLGLSLLMVAFTIGYNLNIMKSLTGEFVSFSTLWTSLYTMITVILTGAGMGLMLFLIYGTFKWFHNFRNGYYDG